ncbi:MAG: 16S rRNA (cytosine(1402)-N(4))-methyltransferase RsmH [Defluviitaleaceae bacterium]|nr:16S rRNA (cytosine(1402)-N(4))-methyltransferase RsmH [Defluviitaleaceae bacterium]MCL2263198.1 16S rRNA (cytosine(1402)-N(4))-methyltransferase RsmH [Defluviitaleaceae bacterium]
MVKFEHIPVMLSEAVEGLNIKSEGVYVDCTLGGGGHSAAICQMLTTGKLIGIDRDENAINAASDRIGSKNFTAVHGNFHDLPDILDKLNVAQVDGILMDLGISSHQIDTAERGFSFRFNGPLDMRMDRTAPLTAKDIVNLYDEKELVKILFEYGEERHSRRIARSICAEREISPIETTTRLAEIIENAQPRAKYGKHQPHPAMRSFMALRIAVNDELSPLASVLKNAVPFLRKGGRFAAITFHSLEDRIVKTTFAKLANPCDCPRDIPYCVCGKTPSLRVITRKPITPSPQELTNNSRAHSAKLRVAEKI